VEQADTTDLKSVGLTLRAGSSPASSTKKALIVIRNQGFLISSQLILNYSRNCCI